ncbi:MAG: hypothetical protein WCL71_06810 [Deltaproteobacteria bacterium]
MNINRIAAILLSIVATSAYGAEPESTKAATVDAVRNGLVGVWNGVWDEPNMHMSYVLSFDAQGRITEEGIVGEGGMLLGEDAPRKGMVKYRLEANKDGAGVTIIEIDGKGAETSIYVVDQIGADSVTMRSINVETKKINEPVVWKRIRTEPYPIKTEKEAEKKAN